MQSNQDQIFADFEGDSWFRWNKDTLEGFDPGADFPPKLMELYHLCSRNVLEIGAANGYRLAAISERYGARMVAVERSVEAILDGESRFPCVEFVRGWRPQFLCKSRLTSSL